MPEDMLNSSQGLFAFLLRMEKARSPEELRSAIRVLIERLKDNRYVSLRRAFTVWTRRVLLSRMVPKEPVPEVNDLEGIEILWGLTFFVTFCRKLCHLMSPL